MAATPGAQRALALAGALVSAAIGVVFIVLAIAVTVRWTMRVTSAGVVDSVVWLLVLLFVLLAASTLAVAVSYTRDWKRARLEPLEMDHQIIGRSSSSGPARSRSTTTGT